MHGCKSMKPPHQVCCCLGHRNGAAKSAKELELEDSAHGASNFDKEKAANGAATH